ncbi:MAG: YitT family protein [Eubacteriales bacterium]|nr:YitT family protein [Eubacteriales bacterium]
MFEKKAKRIGEEPTRKESIRSYVICFLGCTLASFAMAFNMKSFVAEGGLFPGSLAGAALLIQRLLQKYAGVSIAYSLAYLPLNIVPIYIGIKYLGKKFTVFSIYVTILTSTLTDLFPLIPITSDEILVCIFGGIIQGGAVASALLAGASAGGTDFISIYLSEKKGIDAFDYIFAGNIVLLFIAGLFFGWDKALYSIIFQYAQTQIIHALYQRYTKRTMIIITEHPEAVYTQIRLFTNHDATLFNGEGLYKGMRKHMIYSVVDTDEVDMLLKLIHEVDPHAFINIMKTDTLSGRFYSRRKS